MDGVPGSVKTDRVLYKPGFYYRKEKKEKVSVPTGVNKGKALVKPIYEIDGNSERSALDKPNLTLTYQDGKALIKPGEGGNGDGRKQAKGREKETQERIQLLERQVENERVAQLEKAYEEQQQAQRAQQEAARREMGKLITEREEKLRIAEQKGQMVRDEDTAMETAEEDVYEVEECMIQAGQYYNVRASRMIMLEDKLVLGDGRGVRRKEAGFNIKGEGRLSKVVWRHRMDEGSNITLSFNPANLKCSRCLVRGVHLVVGAEDGRPVVLVASDQNFPPVLFSRVEQPVLASWGLSLGQQRSWALLLPTSYMESRCQQGVSYWLAQPRIGKARDRRLYGRAGEDYAGPEREAGGKGEGCGAATGPPGRNQQFQAATAGG
jgi:hypothetical protein